MSYVLIVIAFVVTAIGVFGDTFDKDRHRPTVRGWLIIGAAAIACLVSIYFEYFDSREKQAKAFVANTEFIRAVEIVILPFFWAVPERFNDPFWSIEVGGKDSFKALLSDEFIDQLPDANSDHYKKFNADKNHAAKLFVERINSINQSYEKYLKAETVLMFTELQRDPFIESATESNPDSFYEGNYRPFMERLSKAFDRVTVEILSYRSENP